MSARDDLVSGYKRFREHRYPQDIALYERLSGGQQPKVMLITCSDSRICPEALFHAKPGDLFVYRNVANLVPAYDKKAPLGASIGAALEYAVTVLGVEQIIVMGHAGCGGIANILQAKSEANMDFVDTWTEIGANLAQIPASQADRQTQCEKASIVQSLTNLQTYPWIQGRVSAGRLTCEGWYLSVGDAQIEAYDPNYKIFEPLTQA